MSPNLRQPTASSHPRGEPNASALDRAALDGATGPVLATRLDSAPVGLRQPSKHGPDEYGSGAAANHAPCLRALFST